MGFCIREDEKDFYELLKKNALEKEGEPCFIFYEYNGMNRREISIDRKQLLDRSLSIGKELKVRGAKKGDRVIVLSTQTADNVLSISASILAGTIFTIIPPPTDLSKMERFKSVIQSCNPKFILCGTLLEEKLNEILTFIKKDEKFKKLIEDIQVINVDKCIDNEGFVPEKIELDDTIYIQYTSGSTSAPKGVMIGYENVISAIECVIRDYNIRNIVAWVPFFHNLGLVYCILTPIIRPELKIGVMSPSAFLEVPERWIKLLSEFKADTTLAPNSVYDSYPKLVPAETLKDIDLSNMKLLLNGSEIITEGTLRRFEKEYGQFGISKAAFCNGYGLSEATCAASDGNYCEEKDLINIDFEQYKSGKLKVADDNTKDSIQFVSSGSPMNLATIKIVNPDTLEECKEDEFGEIWVQAPYVAQGYYRNEEATKETFKCELKGYEGYFLRTGDLGILKDNRLFITGRIKELIIINGNNILPNDIVSKLKEEISEIQFADIVPFSIVTDKKEKLVIILGVPGKMLENLNVDAIKEKINKCILNNFEVTPYDIKFVDGKELPKSDNGKISIKAAAKKYEDDTILKTKTIIEYSTETEHKLGSIIKNDFSHEAGREENLLSLGMDSLEVVGLSKSIEKAFDVSVPVSFIFESPFISKISEYIDRTLNGEDLSLLEKDKSYLYDEVVLDESIKPGKYETDKPEMKNVFITGTTGFVGAYLISAFAKFTKAKLYCHVRAKDKESGLKRIKENMEYYKLWKEEYAEFIVPITGSLNEPLLGIDENEYKFLAENIDTIIHNGAILNFIYPYERLKETNVLGTVKTLALACEGKPKYYNYISSYSVFDNPSHFKKRAEEDDQLEDCKGYFLSYSESKWVSENIIHVARERGLRAAIYRPGEITGANDTGIWKLSDSLSRTIRAMLVTKTYPAIPMKVHMTQVDYIADAIVNIAMRGDSYGKGFNLMNDIYVPLKWIGDVANQMGYETKEIPFEEWKKNLFEAGNEHPLKLLESLFKVQKKNDAESFVNRYGEMSPIYDDTRNAKKALEGTGVKCDSMNDELLKKYINNFTDKVLKKIEK